MHPGRVMQELLSGMILLHVIMRHWKRFPSSHLLEENGAILPIVYSELFREEEVELHIDCPTSMPVSDRELVGVTQVEYVERCTDRPTYENVCTGFVDTVKKSCHK